MGFSKLAFSIDSFCEHEYVGFIIFTKSLFCYLFSCYLVSLLFLAGVEKKKACCYPASAMSAMVDRLQQVRDGRYKKRRAEKRGFQPP
jgi:hypothetical protein